MHSSPTVQNKKIAHSQQTAKKQPLQSSRSSQPRQPTHFHVKQKLKTMNASPPNHLSLSELHQLFTMMSTVGQNFAPHFSKANVVSVTHSSTLQINTAVVHLMVHTHPTNLIPAPSSTVLIGPILVGLKKPKKTRSASPTAHQSLVHILPTQILLASF